MNNILAAKVLISHLPDVMDGAYRTAIEIAIETLISEAKTDYYNINPGISLKEYLELPEEEFKKWVMR